MKMSNVQDMCQATRFEMNVHMIYCMKLNVGTYDFGPKTILKSIIHILPIFGQTNTKTTVV